MLHHLKKLLGYSCACPVPVVPWSILEGGAHGLQQDLAVHHVLTLCHLQVMYTTVHCLPATRIDLRDKDLPRGFSMAMTVLCWLLTLTEHGHRCC